MNLEGSKDRIFAAGGGPTVAKLWQKEGVKPLILLERAKGFEPSTFTLAR